MAVVGGVLETKQIGLAIGVSGTHHDTEIDAVTSQLRLKQIDTNESGKAVYAKEGHWISDVIHLEDRFADFDKVFTTNTDSGSSTIAVLTRVSDDKTIWSDWVAIAMDGAIQSETKQYIQVKIVLYAGYVQGTLLSLTFKGAQDASQFDNNKYIDTTNGLKLKREYDNKMTRDETWTEEGSLFRQKIVRGEWARIDSVSVE